MLKSLLFFLLISIQLAAQTTYYVSNSQGNDSNNGTTDSSPWKTLSKVSNVSLNPGDQVLFRKGDIWLEERLTISRSGTQGNLISYRTYGSGDKPLFNGNNVFNDYIIRLTSNVQYISFEDIEVKGLNFIGLETAGVIQLLQRVSNIKFRNCKFSTNTFNIEQGNGLVTMRDPAFITFENCEFSGTMQGVVVFSNYNNSKNDAHNLTFTNNYFHDLDPRQASGDIIRGVGVKMFIWWLTSPDSINDGAQPGTLFGQEGTIRDIIFNNNRFERITANGIMWYWHLAWTVAGIKGYNWNITNNIGKNIGHCFIDLAPIGSRGGLANKSVFSFNNVDSSGWDYRNGQILSNPNSGYVNVVQSHNWDNWIIENNQISNVTMELGDGHAIILDYNLDPSYGCESMVIRNNIIWGINSNTIVATASSGINLYTSQNSEVYNNVIFDSRNGIHASGSRTINALIYNNTIVNISNDGIVGNAGVGLNIKNNIFYGCNKAIETGGSMPGYSADYNLFFNNNSNSAGNGNHNIFSNPNFINYDNKNFNVNDEGAGIDAGIAISGNILPRLFDILGNAVPHNNLWDIGAYEYGSSGGGSNSINVNLNIFLEGSFDNGGMVTTLLNNGHLPLVQPYTQAPWNYTGNETVSSVPPGVVDWILLELRTGTSSSALAGRKAAFLKSDGSVVGLDGVSKVNFDGLSSGSYYVVIRHRNHLDVMSANPLTLSDNSDLYDFTTGPGKAYGSDPMSDLGNGKWGMTAGDGDLNGLVNVIDYGTVGNFLFAAGYNFGDLDMNGIINVLDYAKTNLNLFRNSQVPN